MFAAWGYGGWRAAARVLERRMMVLAGVRYAATVMIGLAAGLVVSVALLWGSLAPPTPGSDDQRLS